MSPGRLRHFGLKLFQCLPDQRAHHAGGQAIRQRMHRHDAVDVDEFIFAWLDQFRFRMINIARLQRVGFAVHEKFPVHGVPVLHPRLGLPPATMQEGGAVIKHTFEHRPRSALPAFDAGRHNFAAHRGRLF